MSIHALCQLKARPRRRRSTGKEADFLALDATPDARFTGSSQRVTGIIGVRPGGDFEATVRHKPGQYTFPKLKPAAYLANLFWFRPFDLLQALFGRPKRKERQETYRDFRENPCYNSQNSSFKTRRRRS